MRHKGRIADWQDEKGFGFIEPLAGGDRVFAHIKSFPRRGGRRPVEGELVSYEVSRDPQGRPQGINIAFSGWRASSTPGSLFAVVFLLLVAAAVLTNQLPPIVFGAYALGSIIAFLTYAWDKSAARSGRWRVQESTLHLLGLLCGWPGSLIAQSVIRHKSRKRSFQFVFWVTVAANCAALGWVFQNLESIMSYLSAVADDMSSPDDPVIVTPRGPR